MEKGGRLKKDFSAVTFDDFLAGDSVPHKYCVQPFPDT
jgi:hypothetical protein